MIELVVDQGGSLELIGERIDRELLIDVAAVELVAHRDVVGQSVDAVGCLVVRRVAFVQADGWRDDVDPELQVCVGLVRQTRQLNIVVYEAILILHALDGGADTSVDESDGLASGIWLNPLLRTLLLVLEEDRLHLQHFLDVDMDEVVELAVVASE